MLCTVPCLHRALQKPLRCPLRLLHHYVPAEVPFETSSRQLLPLPCRDGNNLKAYPQTHTGMLNFTNPSDTPNSAGCAVNGLLYQESAPMQEVIGDLMEINLENIDLHPYHHHTQP